MAPISEKLWLLWDAVASAHQGENRYKEIQRKFYVAFCASPALKCKLYFISKNVCAWDTLAFPHSMDAGRPFSGRTP